MALLNNQAHFQVSQSESIMVTQRLGSHTKPGS
jgi:hypothetical protein